MRHKTLLHTSAAIILGLLAPCVISHARAEPEKIRVILDTDANNELDDQHAIAYLLFSGDTFNIEGVTVNRTRNGGGLDKHLAEARRVVRLCGSENTVPVLPGADRDFNRIKGDLERPDFDGAEAVDFILRKAREPENRQLVLLPIGKLTNIALALAKDPSIASRVRIVWLGSNYPEPGEYNQNDDEAALDFILHTNVRFEIALVRSGKPSGTAAVVATLDEINRTMPGTGPRIDPPVTGRHGDRFSCFGDYSVSLFKNIKLHGSPPARSLYDMAAVAIVRNAAWATPRSIPAPILKDGKWSERPDNPRKIVLWENFDRAAIMNDFHNRMDHPQLTGSRSPAS
ncbi:MAG: nucleoside hydrolase [Akkermansiaceae bacterium]|nr:nucleoside hydrolase [Akkermansiaceae bacterium]